MNNELKMMVHELIEKATQALKRYDKNDDHWKVLLSLLRYEAKVFIEEFEKNESDGFWNGEEE